MIISACGIPVVVIPIVSCGTDLRFFDGIAVALKNIIPQRSIMHRADHLHQIPVRFVRPACVVIDQCPAVGASVKFYAPAGEVREC